MSNKQIFIINKVNEKESTGDNSFQNNGDKEFISSKNLFQDFKLLSKNNDSFGFDIFGESNESYDSIKLFSTEDLFNNNEKVESFDFIEKNKELNNLYKNYNYDDENSFQNNRNNFNNNLINEKTNNYKEKRSKRCDSLMIKFKAYVGKWLITTINEKLLDLRKKSIIKRTIKFYAFNYKKFTIKVSYEQNKHWLMSKLEELLLLGDEENQIKNEKSLKLLNKKKLIELKEIKDMLNLTYEDAIKAFYKSDYFKQKFKEDKRVIELNNNFIKIMDISLLEPNGFIRFIETRKGNKRKEE
jgi:hypothetical protein